jgi:hypothetical protein
MVKGQKLESRRPSLDVNATPTVPHENPRLNLREWHVHGKDI